MLQSCLHLETTLVILYKNPEKYVCYIILCSNKSVCACDYVRVIRRHRDGWTASVSLSAGEGLGTRLREGRGSAHAVLHTFHQKAHRASQPKSSSLLHFSFG